MDLQELINTLETHNEWRKGANTPPTDPKKLTEALEKAIKILKQLN